ncbi:hypothetical protein BURMUCGD2_6066 [Burkholderia multivorans CGD2]|uniref:Uncharacterized protein n=1 Tax=Burkholderia multivorans CGD2 TaxID=513052 RepID=B9BLV8_9BURK|nr:hypothetical protein BURMUCGD2_6066 [Burkholderia multivorans CGD2]
MLYGRFDWYLSETDGAERWRLCIFYRPSILYCFSRFTHSIFAEAVA